MAKKVTETKASGLFSDALVLTLIDRPGIKIVYVNEKGEWLFHPRPGFQPFEVSEIVK